jgi:hypothetical protein
MKMSEHDKYMATQRSQKFIEDRERMREVFQKVMNGSATGKDPMVLYEELCGKWDISFFSMEARHESDPETAMHKHRAVELVTSGKWASIRFGLENYEKAHLPFIVTKGPLLYLPLQIDLSRSAKDLMAEFSRLVTLVKEKCCGGTGGRQYTEKAMKVERSRQTVYNKWGIWDEVEQTGSPLLKIARKLSGEDPPRGKRTPAYKPDLWPPYKRVYNAYRKANKLIEAVEQAADIRMKAREQRSFSHGPFRYLDPDLRDRLCEEKD